MGFTGIPIQSSSTWQITLHFGGLKDNSETRDCSWGNIPSPELWTGTASEAGNQITSPQKWSQCYQTASTYLCIPHLLSFGSIGLLQLNLTQEEKSTCYQAPINSEQIASRVEKNYFLNAFLEDTAATILDAHQQTLGNQHHKGMKQGSREGQDKEIRIL